MLRHSFHTLNRISLAILTISLGIGIDGIPVALAQGASLEEIIVTARKRDENLMDIPESVSAIVAVEVERRNIMGVVVPSVSGTNLKSTFAERGIGFIGSSPYIDEASDSFSELIEKIVKASEMEATLKRLLAEIEATKRRVNALEFKVIPELEEAKVFIQLRLEEMEREETFRLKRFKNK